MTRVIRRKKSNDSDKDSDEDTDDEDNKEEEYDYNEIAKEYGLKKLPVIPKKKFETKEDYEKIYNELIEIYGGVAIKNSKISALHDHLGEQIKVAQSCYSALCREADKIGVKKSKKNSDDESEEDDNENDSDDDDSNKKKSKKKSKKVDK
jgi:hypothetical protein